MSNFEAHHNFARISARKARYVADLIRGKNVNTALDVLNFTHRRGSSFLSILLRSAISNATQDGKVNANKLYIRELTIDGGPLIQGRFRYNPGPMGRAMPIRKRTSHIHLLLAERAEETKKRAPKKKAAEDATSQTLPKRASKARSKAPSVSE
ncbi:MAG: 50S ribosomal protein L22 [Planctomycetes bacterium]|nr:50S ribosomal protein L22 [Planctomycetota bacterium]